MFLFYFFAIKNVIRSKAHLMNEGQESGNILEVSSKNLLV